MNIAIVYYSRHHANTKKLLDAIAKVHPVTLIDVSDGQPCDLSAYDMVGFASGIYYSSFHRSVLNVAREQLPAGKKVFFLYTYGAKKDGYTKAIAAAVGGKAQIAGEYGCYGFNTFGPFKLIGGIAKGHPNADDIQRAVDFVTSIAK